MLLFLVPVISKDDWITDKVVSKLLNFFLQSIEFTFKRTWAKVRFNFFLPISPLINESIQAELWVLLRTDKDLYGTSHDDIRTKQSRNYSCVLWCLRRRRDFDHTSWNTPQTLSHGVRAFSSHRPLNVKEFSSDVIIFVNN